MNINDFATYEQALALKKLGFDEPCLGFYVKYTDGDVKLITNSKSTMRQIEAPLKQQVFRWFRGKYNLFSVCFPMLDEWVIEIKELKGFEGNPAVTGYPDLDYKTYEEAESACIDKLIELVKAKL